MFRRNKMPTIALVNTPESPCPGTHGAACREFLEGWESFGFSVGEATTLQECQGYSWLLLSNHGMDWDFLHRLAEQNPETIFICWCWHDFITRVPFKRWILTGEQYVDPPTLAGHVAAHAKALAIPNYQPLLLRVPEDPTRIGTFPRSIQHKYLAFFAGSGYRRDWVRDIPDIVYHDVYASGLMSAEERRSYHLQSLFALGFHSPENVANHHVTQRVFEGMAYGCIVLSDNPAAAKLTDGIVEYVGSRRDMMERMAYFLWNHDLAEAKRKEGYKWVKKFGTNRYAAQCFLNHSVRWKEN